MGQLVQSVCMCGVADVCIARALARPEAITTWASSSTLRTCKEWEPLLQCASPQTSGASVLTQAAHPLPTLQHDLDHKRFAEVVAADASRSPALHRQREWDAMHRGVLSEHCEQGGRCPPVNKRCFLAQRCICSGDGVFVAKFHQRLQAAFHAAGKAMKAGEFRELLCGATLVLRVRTCGGEQVADTPAADQEADAQDATGGTTEEEWLHIAAMNLRPWRPTFLRMQRHPPYDRSSAIGLQAVRKETGPTMLVWQTVWDAIASLVDLDARVVISWYRLLETTRAVVDLNLSKQRVVALGLSDMEVWRGKVVERLRKKQAPKWAGPKASAPRAMGASPLVPLQPAQVDSDASISEGGAEEDPDEPPEQFADQPAGDDEAGEGGSDSASSSEPSCSDAEDEAPATAPLVGAPPIGSGLPSPGPASGALGDEEEGAIALDGADFDAALELIGRPSGDELVAAAAPSDAHPPAAAEDRPPRAPIVGRSRAAVAAILPGMRGMLRRYASTNTVVMHCPYHTEEKCRLTRSLKPSTLASRQGQGRPLGLLLAWAKNCDSSMSAAEHVHSFTPPSEQRMLARRELNELATEVEALRELLALERPQRPGEPEEPIAIN